MKILKPSFLTLMQTPQPLFLGSFPSLWDKPHSPCARPTIRAVQAVACFTEPAPICPHSPHTEPEPEGRGPPLPSVRQGERPGPVASLMMRSLSARSHMPGFWTPWWGLSSPQTSVPGGSLHHLLFRVMGSWVQVAGSSPDGTSFRSPVFVYEPHSTCNPCPQLGYIFSPASWAIFKLAGPFYEMSESTHFSCFYGVWWIC